MDTCSPVWVHLRLKHVGSLVTDSVYNIKYEALKLPNMEYSLACHFFVV